MEICNRPGLDKMVVTSANSQHQQQHIHRLQEQFEQLQPPAGTGKSGVYSQLVFDFNIFVNLFSNVIMSSSRALKCRSAVEVSVSEVLYIGFKTQHQIFLSYLLHWQN